MELALVLRLQSAVLVRLKRARFVLSRRGRRRLLPALRSRANFSSSAGFDGFAKEIATTGPTNSLRKSRFCVVAAQPSRSGSVVGSTCHRLRLGGRIVVTFAAERPLQSRSGPLAFCNQGNLGSSPADVRQNAR